MGLREIIGRRSGQNDAQTLGVLFVATLFSTTAAEARVIGFETCTPRDTSTYSTATTVNLKSETMLISSAMGIGDWDDASERLSVWFAGGYTPEQLPVTDHELRFAIRVNTAVDGSMLYVTLTKGASVYGGGSMSLMDLEMGVFHEVVMDTGVFEYGSWTVDFTLGHAPLGGSGVGVSVDFAAAVPALLCLSEVDTPGPPESRQPGGPGAQMKSS